MRMKGFIWLAILLLLSVFAFAGDVPQKTIPTDNVTPVAVLYIQNADGSYTAVRTGQPLPIAGTISVSETPLTNWNAYALSATAVEGNQNYGQDIKDTVIINDGSADLLVGFNISTASKSFTLKQGDSFNTDLVYSNLYYATSSGTANFRVFVAW